jgi:hypothetical protein
MKYIIRFSSVSHYSANHNSGFQALVGDTDTYRIQAKKERREEEEP